MNGLILRSVGFTSSDFTTLGNRLNGALDLINTAEQGELISLNYSTAGSGVLNHSVIVVYRASEVISFSTI